MFINVIMTYECNNSLFSFYICVNKKKCRTLPSSWTLQRDLYICDKHKTTIHSAFTTNIHKPSGPYDFSRHKRFFPFQNYLRTRNENISSILSGDLCNCIQKNIIQIDTMKLFQQALVCRKDYVTCRRVTWNK